jgi:transposase-like protein
MNVHRKAKTTPESRELLVQRAQAEGWSRRKAAEAFGLSVRTTAKWLQRFRQEGLAGLTDRSCRPRRSPRICNATPLMNVLFSARKSNRSCSGLFAITTTSPLGKEVAVDADDCPGSAIARVGNSSKALTKTRGMWTGSVAEAGAPCFNIYASSESPRGWSPARGPRAPRQPDPMPLPPPVSRGSSWSTRGGRGGTPPERAGEADRSRRGLSSGVYRETPGNLPLKVRQRLSLSAA